jgi:SAM-dependent methyltransferase
LQGKRYTRSDYFPSDKVPNVCFDDWTRPCVIEELPNPYYGKSPVLSDGELWRHHDWCQELIDNNQFHETYAYRVETILATIDNHMRSSGIMSKLPDMTVCDLACSVGFTSIKCIRDGAKQVDAFDINMNELERFQKAAASLWIHQVRFLHADLEHPLWSLAVGTYQLVFCLGILYHTESPLLFMRNLYRTTGKYCYLETDSYPLMWPDGNRAVVNLERSGVTLRPGQVRYVLEQRPSHEAVVELAMTAGFTSIEHLPPVGEDKTGYYTTGVKSVFFLRK